MLRDRRSKNLKEAWLISVLGHAKLAHLFATEIQAPRAALAIGVLGGLQGGLAYLVTERRIQKALKRVITEVHLMPLPEDQGLSGTLPALLPYLDLRRAEKETQRLYLEIKTSSMRVSLILQDEASKPSFKNLMDRSLLVFSDSYSEAYLKDTNDYLYPVLLQTLLDSSKSVVEEKVEYLQADGTYVEFQPSPSYPSQIFGLFSTQLLESLKGDHVDHWHIKRVYQQGDRLCIVPGCLVFCLSLGLWFKFSPGERTRETQLKQEAMLKLAQDAMVS